MEMYGVLGIQGITMAQGLASLVAVPILECY